MSRKIFSLVIFLLLAAFMVVSIGGCGSSKNSLSDTSPEGGGTTMETLEEIHLMLHILFLMKTVTMMTETEYLTF